ncbi:MAG: fimbrial protein [Delftia tsuruhatensis]
MKNALRILKSSFIPLTWALTTPSTWALCKLNTSDGLPYFTAELSGMTVPEFAPGDYNIGSTIYKYSGPLKLTNKIPESKKPQFECAPGIEDYLTGIGPHENGLYAAPGTIKNIKLKLSAFTIPFPFLVYSTVPKTSGNWNEASFYYDIELIKTGPISSGGTLSGSFAQSRANDATGQLLVDFRFAGPVVIRPRVPTCKVRVKEIRFDMGAVLMRSSGGVGATSASSEEQNIQLDCSGGDTGTATQVYVTLTDVTDRNNTSSNLTLNRTSTARGIAAQILSNGKPVRFGTEADDTSRWLAGDVPQGQTAFSIPLQGRYVQTEDRVVPGSANASAEFTIHYQ